MSTRSARVVMLLSSVALVAVLITAVTSRGDASADLVGPPVTAADAAEPPATERPSPPARAVVPGAPAVAAPTDPVLSGVAVPTPIALRIGSLGIDAEVVPVDVDEDGSLDVPDATHVGWYRDGVAPGAPAGSSVLTAHVDYDGRPGVFLELSRLEVGEEVVTDDATGAERRFVVTERYQVAKGDLDADELFRREGAPTLTLITCGGSFDERRRHYSDNIVVRAVPA